MSEEVENVRGKQVLIQFEAKKCIHSRGCVLGRPDVFVPNVQGEWIHPDAATPEEIAALAQGCPSGAIRYQRLDGGPDESAPVVNLIRVRENGPLALHAPLEIDGVQSGFRATLCRCGASQNKPYCDGSHTAAGFAATGEPPTEASEPLAQRDGPLRVTRTGRTVNRMSKVALCRCGHSSKKPYCDGTHRTIGFKSE
jgi:CDGSH-type Zn-finger protein/uncharacterized Fe-S cluster protein YjdI